MRRWRSIHLGIGPGWPVFDSPVGPVFFKEGGDDGTNTPMLGLRRQRSGLVILSNSSNTRALMAPLVHALPGGACLPWYWMGHVPYDVKLPADAREHPPVTPGCG